MFRVCRITYPAYPVASATREKKARLKGLLIVQLTGGMRKAVQFCAHVEHPSVGCAAIRLKDAW